MSALQKKLQMSHLPPNLPPSGLGPRKTPGARPAKRRKDYTATSWDKYFQRHRHVSMSETDTFSVYESGETGPVLVFLHGGGFSALTWALLAKSIADQVTCKCLAIDLRGHGTTKTSDDEDLSADTMVKDIAAVVNKVCEDDVSKIIIGHSMGGALAVHVCQQGLIAGVAGLVVIDVVEGTALDALTGMQSFLRSRPAQFKSLENAIEWCVRSGQIRNAESAKVSMVGQLRRLDDNEAATESLTTTEAQGHGADSIIEEEDQQEEQEEQEVNGATESKADSTALSRAADVPYTWRIDLTKTEKFWRGWFEGLSSKFLSCQPPKMLLLAGVDRLDKELTVGQMQGKFQMQVLPQCGHAVHEDVPDKVADALCTFMVRHKLAQPSQPFNRVFPSC